ncbi:MAG TPA: glycosyltransferase [Vicinamibacterales bacterium]|nr:glycosyltransferase [Vicinamibacterales bacterium]
MGLTTLHITNSYHPTSGGIRTFYHALLEAGNEVGRSVRLIVPGPKTTIEEVGAFGRIYSVKAPHAPVFDRRYRLITPSAFMPAVRSEVIDILERERPDVVELCDKYSLPYLAAMLRKRWHPRVPRPALVGLTCERFDDNMSAYVSDAPWARAFTRWYIRHIYGPPFDAHIANSDYTAGELRTALHDRDPWFIRTCPMGVDADGFGPSRRNPALRTHLLCRARGAAESTLVFYAGRLSPEKNIALLVDAMRELAIDRAHDFRLVVAGDGPLADPLRRQATGMLEGRIVLCGNLTRETLADYCASCDVFVHPNPREPFGIGPLEAMASGVPVVVPDSGGVLEYASPGNAWLAQPTATAFAAAIRAARSGDDARIAAAAKTADRFRWRDATRRYFDAYDDIHGRVRHTWRSKRAPAA